MKPIWQVAQSIAMDKAALAQLCESGLVLGAQFRGVGDSAQWWIPDPPTILQARDKLSIRGAVPGGMLPLIIVARRDGIEPTALARMCRLGRVDGATKSHGQWVIPEDVRVEKPRRGRAPLDLSQWNN